MQLCGRMLHPSWRSAEEKKVVGALAGSTKGGAGRGRGAALGCQRQAGEERGVCCPQPKRSRSDRAGDSLRTRSSKRPQVSLYFCCNAALVVDFSVQLILCFCRVAPGPLMSPYLLCPRQFPRHISRRQSSDVKLNMVVKYWRPFSSVQNVLLSYIRSIC